MAKKLMLAIMTIFAGMQFGCEEPENPNEKAYREFSGEMTKQHPIRKSFTAEYVVNTADGSATGGYFLFLGGGSASYSAKSMTVQSIKFAWEDKDSTYILTEVPIDKVRVKLVSESCAPSVQLFFRYYCNTPSEMRDLHGWREDFDLDQQVFMKYMLNYIVITCCEKDWEPSIKLPWNESAPTAEKQTK